MNTMQDQPFVSIIIPVFNGERLIDGCLERLLNQTYPKERLEILVVDNGSTDDSAAFVKKFPVRIAQCSTKGPAAARNEGIRQSRGEIILFVDIDCLANSDLVERHVRIHEKFKRIQPDTVMVCGGIKGFNRNLWSLCDDFCSWSLYHANLKPRWIKRMCPTANLSVRKTVFSQIGLFNEGLLFGEDFEFCHRALTEKLKIYFEPKAIVYHINRTTFSDFMVHARNWALADDKLYDIGVLPVHHNFFMFIAFYSLFLVAFILQPVFSGLMAGRFIILLLFPVVFINRVYIWFIRVSLHYRKRKLS